jgi:hypothetical protein
MIGANLHVHYCDVRLPGRSIFKGDPFMRKLFVILSASVVASSSYGFWSQPNDSADGYFSDALSQINSNWYGQSMADSFFVPTGPGYNNLVITFWGSSENFTTPNLDNISDFEFNIYDDTFTAVYSATVALSQLNATATGAQNALGGNEYMFTWTLPTNVVLDPGFKLLNIGAVLIAGGDDAWVWSQSFSGDSDNLFAYTLDGNTWQALAGQGDMAFIVTGQPVPEPATMAALGLGLAAIARRRRRK